MKFKDHLFCKAFAVFAFSSAASESAIPLYDGVPYTQSFNGLDYIGLGSTKMTLPDSWDFEDADSTYTPSTGSVTQGICSFGTNWSTDKWDRAFGGVRQISGSTIIGASTMNQTGAEKIKLRISYVGEQWRLGGTAGTRLDFQYSTNATSVKNVGGATWIDFDALDFSAPVSSGSLSDFGALNGNFPENRTHIEAVIPSIEIPNGGTFWIRWKFNSTGNDGLAVDDLSIVAEPAVFHVSVTAQNGTVTGAGEYATGTSVSLTAAAAPGYVFGAWSGDASGTTNPLSVIVNDNKTITGNFIPDTNDTDGDGLTNYQEIVERGTDPTKPDTDGDGVNDKADTFPLDSLETLDNDNDGTGDNADPDDDNDGYSDPDEIAIHHTNPKLADSDGDDLTDPAEIETHHTNPNLADTDTDGLRDGEEFTTYHTNPLAGDTDGDGFLDGYEVLTGKLPLDPLDKPALVAEARTAIEFTFPAAIGKIYRIEASTDLAVWAIVESGIAGNGSVIQRFYSTRGQPHRYFRVEDESP